MREDIEEWGYFHNNVNEYIEKVDGEYKFFADGEHIYVRSKKEEAFNVNGEKIGVVELSRERFTKKEKKEKGQRKEVYQVNYEFYILPTGRCHDMDEVSSCSYLLTDLLKVTPYHQQPDVNLEYLRGIYRNGQYWSHNEWENREPFVGIEICKHGYSRSIVNKTRLKIVNLSIAEYTKRKNDFVKLHPDHKNEVELLYQVNIAFLMRFWQKTKKQILADRFDRHLNAIHKLHRKITTIQNKTI